VLDRAGDAQVGIARAVERPEVAAHVVDREPLDVGARADDALAERVVLDTRLRAMSSALISTRPTSGPTGATSRS